MCVPGGQPRLGAHQLEPARRPDDGDVEQPVGGVGARADLHAAAVPGGVADGDHRDRQGPRLAVQHQRQLARAAAGPARPGRRRRSAGAPSASAAGWPGRRRRSRSRSTAPWPTSGRRCGRRRSVVDGAGGEVLGRRAGGGHRRRPGCPGPGRGRCRSPTGRRPARPTSPRRPARAACTVPSPPTATTAPAPAATASAACFSASAPVVAGSSRGDSPAAPERGEDVVGEDAGPAATGGGADQDGDVHAGSRPRWCGSRSTARPARTGGRPAARPRRPRGRGSPRSPSRLARRLSTIRAIWMAPLEEHDHRPGHEQHGERVLGGRDERGEDDREEEDPAPALRAAPRS